MKVCKLCFSGNSLKNEDWKFFEETRGLKLSLDSNASSGFYMCKMFPYRIDTDSTLFIEIKKSFEVEVIGECDTLISFE